MFLRVLSVFSFVFRICTEWATGCEWSDLGEVIDGI
jgi:hypothetical protein